MAPLVKMVISGCADGLLRWLWMNCLWIVHGYVRDMLEIMFYWYQLNINIIINYVNSFLYLEMVILWISMDFHRFPWVVHGDPPTGCHTTWAQQLCPCATDLLHLLQQLHRALPLPGPTPSAVHGILQQQLQGCASRPQQQVFDFAGGWIFGWFKVKFMWFTIRWFIGGS